MSYTCNSCQVVLKAGQICTCKMRNLETINSNSYAMGWWDAMDACRNAGIKTAPDPNFGYSTYVVSVEAIENKIANNMGAGINDVAKAIHELIYDKQSTKQPQSQSTTQ